MLKQMTIAALAVLALGTSVAAKGYKDAGECANAVVDFCNAKYEPGYALERCVLNGVNQCIAAFPDKENGSSARPSRGRLKFRPLPGRPTHPGTRGRRP